MHRYGVVTFNFINLVGAISLKLYRKLILGRDIGLGLDLV